jgi:aminoglycoside phosphotransferase (APT) family kinase protein
LKSTDPHWRYQRVIRKLEPDGKVLRCSDLQGGVSAQATLVEFGVPDRAPEKVVVRRFGEADLRRNPDLAYDQFSLMLSLRRAGLAVPIPYLLDASGEIFAAPYLVLEYIEGSTELAPSEVESGINQLAEYLAEIHKIPGTDRAVSRLPKFEDICAAELRRPKAYSSDSSPKGAWDRASEDPAKGSTEDFADGERIREILLAVMPLPQRNSPALLHGDYWPGNVVWQGGRIAAVIDWEDAAVGDPLADVSNARLEILWAFGPDCMDDFTRHYHTSRPQTDFTGLPYWDLYAAFRLAPSKFAAWGLEPEKEAIVRERHGWFVDQAFKKQTEFARGEA